jgi:hypothetical protein
MSNITDITSMFAIAADFSQKVQPLECIQRDELAEKDDVADPTPFRTALLNSTEGERVYT